MLQMVTPTNLSMVTKTFCPNLFTRDSKENSECLLTLFFSNTVPDPQSSSRLLWVDEVPRVLAYNKFVKSGYRAGVFLHFSATTCLSIHVAIDMACWKGVYIGLENGFSSDHDL